ncbi:alpha/beta fold hydrolase [Vineibacter terrae]|uniref:alpha/beta fold hydrolase n=1 Tax=Vineibacter terrae TaxID=2586908 RepID=UPI001C49A143|nr:alpha/beta fold hydrolase [Vineibacter terrae]
MAVASADIGPREDYITVAGCRTYVQRAGKGTPVLYLHGANGGGRWLPFMERLAADHEVIAPEHPGFGRSDTPDWFDNIHDVAYFYLDLIDALGLKGVHLVGSSLGGWVACEMAVRSTARLASLALIGSAGLHLKGVARPDTFMWTPEEAARGLFHDQALAEKMLAAAPSDDELERQMKNRFATARLAWAPRFYDPHLHKWLHRIDVPTVVFWGAQDQLVPAVYAERFGELIPKATVHYFDACGHLPQVEQPAAFAEALATFVRRAA